MHSENSTTSQKKRERDRRYCASHREEAKIRAKKWYYANRDKAKKTMRIYAKNHKESIKQSCREYYLQHSDRIKARARLWRQNNKKRKADFDKKWVASNIEKKRSYGRKYANKNREKIVVAGRNWRHANPSRVRDRKHQRRSLEKLSGVSCSSRIKELLQEKSCYWCGKISRLEIDHIVPLRRGGVHCPSNLVSACRSCNASKGNKMYWEWDGELAA